MGKERIEHFVEFTRLTDKELIGYIPIPLKEKVEQIVKYFKRLINGPTIEESVVGYIDLRRQDADTGFLDPGIDKKIESSKEELKKRRDGLYQIINSSSDRPLEDLKESNINLEKLKKLKPNVYDAVKKIKLIDIALSGSSLKKIYHTLESGGYSEICDTLKSMEHPIQKQPTSALY